MQYVKTPVLTRICLRIGHLVFLLLLNLTHFVHTICQQPIEPDLNILFVQNQLLESTRICKNAYLRRPNSKTHDDSSRHFAYRSAIIGSMTPLHWRVSDLTIRQGTLLNHLLSRRLDLFMRKCDNCLRLRNIHELGYQSWYRAWMAQCQLLPLVLKGSAGCRVFGYRMWLRYDDILQHHTRAHKLQREYQIKITYVQCLCPRIMRYVRVFYAEAIIGAFCAQSFFSNS